jgi:carboxymethylenebutenolidase
VIEEHLEIQTADGSMNTFATYPDEGGPFPVVLFYMDAPGKREELHDMARRLAAVGYFVVLPNLYYRVTREFQLVRDQAGMKRMFELMGQLSVEMIMRDTAAILELADGRAEAAARSVGAVGYCMGGPFAFAAAGRFPGRVRCAASIHGVALATDREDSPHRMADQITGEMYFACAETDVYAPVEMIDRLDAHLGATGVRYRVEWYPGTQHGFVFPAREGIYHRPSAERHWARLFALFRRNLEQPG